MFVAETFLELAREQTHIDKEDGAGWGGRILRSVTTSIMPRANELRFARKLQVFFFTAFHRKHRVDTSCFAYLFIIWPKIKKNAMCPLFKAQNVQKRKK